MNQAAEAFLNDVWTSIQDIYQKESQRISDIKDWSRLQAGIKDYLRMAWRKGKLNWANGKIHVDIHEPFKWSDDSYKYDAGSYMEELTEEILKQEFFPALCERMDSLFHSNDYDPHFFDYRFELVFEFEWKQSMQCHSHHFVNERKLESLKQELDHFIETKIMSELPVRPHEKDDFFFAHCLVNLDLLEQKQEVVEPLIQRLSDKLRSNKERSDSWTYHYTLALRGWVEERFLEKYFDRTGHYGMDWVLKPEQDRQEPKIEDLDFFLFVALKMGNREPDTRKKYLDLAVQLGSKQAMDYVKRGSGRFENGYKSSLIQASANDVLQAIDIRIVSEEEAAYGEAIDFINSLLREGFPKGYKLKLKSSEKHYLPLKKLAKSGLHQFFANASRYPALFPKLAEYAELAMEEFAWYGDVEPSEKSVMPGTYAVFALGLSSSDYFPLVQRYMQLVDTEHQSAQDDYAIPFMEAHGVTVEIMPVLVSLLLGSGEGAKPLKNIAIDREELVDALIAELAAMEDYHRETVIYRIFGGNKKLAQAVKKESSSLKDKLAQLLALVG
ncbi:DUF6138 family protein [Brevibacillus fortis]|uniref:Uncharacterized protein n=1 Tax=Brevibacillus fortis TaxID=2126352 RepID=A0A2P7VJZ3_9BACL|nr:DUF6138 family protein [Brevibacillus fortis]PSJ99494.1 hypothetical protein C7R93_02070 [Brevibacillus fortis]